MRRKTCVSCTSVFLMIHFREDHSSGSLGHICIKFPLKIHKKYFCSCTFKFKYLYNVLASNRGLHLNVHELGLPCGPVIKNPPRITRGTGSIPGSGRLHMQQSMYTTTSEVHEPRAHALKQEKPLQ